MEASSKPVNGTWSTSVPLTPKVKATYFAHVYPTVCFDNKGNAVAIWNFPDGDKEMIQTARLVAGSSQWLVETGPLASGLDLLTIPFLQLDQKGRALAIWGNQKSDGTNDIESARLSSIKSQWNVLTPLEIPYAFQGTRMHVNPAGTAWLIYEKSGGFLDGQNVTVSQLSPDSSTWSEPETIIEESGISYNYPQIVSDSQGNVLATWQEYNQNELYFVAYQRLQGSTEWKKTDFQNVETHIYSRGWLTLDPRGDALFVWYPDDNMLMNAHLAQGESSWTSPQRISSEDIYYWRGAIDSNGNRLLSWIKWDDDTLKTTTMPAGESAWSSPDPIMTVKGSLEDCKLSNGSAVILYNDVSLQAIDGKVRM